MTESESEAETESQTLERLEAALRKIAGAVARPKPGGEIDKSALVHALDMLISRLRGGLAARPNGTE